MSLPCCVAVSGGSDSIALLNMLYNTFPNKIIAVTIDHRLRAESTREAQHVSAWCQDLGISHHTIPWNHANPSANIQKKARDARYALLHNFCLNHNISTLCTGHTLDDQAETLFLRLMRGSGVDGLCCIPEVRIMNQLRIIRPLLSFHRSELRNYLDSMGKEWIEDPSNFDDKYDRVKIRALIQNLNLPQERIIQTVERMQLAQEVLERQKIELHAKCLTIDTANIFIIKRETYFSAPLETQLRLLADVLQTVPGSYNRPRWSSLRNLHDIIKDRRQVGSNLHGCIIRLRKSNILIFREHKFCQEPLVIESGKTAIWDNRYHIENKSAVPLIAGALGEMNHEMLQFDNWIQVPFAAKKSCLGLWSVDKQLLAVPDAGVNLDDVFVQSLVRFI